MCRDCEVCSAITLALILLDEYDSKRNKHGLSYSSLMG